MMSDIAPRIHHIISSGTQSAPIIDEIRQTGTCRRTTIQLYGRTLDRNDMGPGVYLDLGVKGSELEERHAIYVGSASGVSTKKLKFTGLARRILEQHENRLRLRYIGVEPSNPFTSYSYINIDFYTYNRTSPLKH
jgi:hypothetical protein